jgi:hypothetical protein
MTKIKDALTSNGKVMGSVMIKTTMVDVILTVVTAAVKMLTKTFAPYVNASKKKLHCQMLLAAVLKTQTIQDSVFALGQTLMIPITLEVAVLKIQTAMELAVLIPSHVMVREPAAVVTAVYAHVTVDLLGIVVT